MKQISFSKVGFEGKKRRTRREVFLAEMERIMLWPELLAVVKPHYPKGAQGRPPIGLEGILRAYFVQQWNGLSDEGVEDAITDSQTLRAFVGINLSRDAAPEATTAQQFRHLLEKHKLTKKLFEAVNGQLSTAGLMMREGTIADATIIAAPPSVKNEADVTQTEHLLHGSEKDVFLDAGYVAADKREGLNDRDINWQIAMKRGKLKVVPEDTLIGQLLRKLESVNASIRSKVEHPFHIVKNLFHHKKVRYKGLAKNTTQLHALFVLANLMIVKQKLLTLDAQVAS